MQDEKHGMTPVFSAAARGGMDPFILRDEKTGGDRKKSIDPEPKRSRYSQGRKQKCQQEETRVGHVTPAFKCRQPPSSMKDEFIDGHDQTLQSGQYHEKDTENSEHLNILGQKIHHESEARTKRERQDSFPGFHSAIGLHGRPDMRQCA